MEKGKKTDLRILKTQKSIRSAFLELRGKTALEKIKIGDLCRLAMINPATFYRHYADIYALSDELEEAAIRDCFERFPYKDCLFTDPEKFALEIPGSLEADPQLLSVLFRGRMDVLYGKLEQLLLEYYRRPNQSPAEDVRLTFLICGSMRTMQLLSADKRHPTDLIAKEMAGMIRQLSEEKIPSSFEG